MASHMDADAIREIDLRSLQEKEKDILRRGLSSFTTGQPGEQPVYAWKHGSVNVCKMPDDEHGICRISIGGGNTHPKRDYLTYRGNRYECEKLLENALEALRARPEAT